MVKKILFSLDQRTFLLDFAGITLVLFLYYFVIILTLNEALCPAEQAKTGFCLPNLIELSINHPSSAYRYINFKQKTMSCFILKFWQNHRLGRLVCEVKFISYFRNIIPCLCSSESCSFLRSRSYLRRRCCRCLSVNLCKLSSMVLL